MHAIWTDKGTFNITEQKLTDKQRQIRKKQCLTNLGLEEIQRRIEDEHMVMYKVIAKVKMSNDF